MRRVLAGGLIVAGLLGLIFTLPIVILLAPSLAQGEAEPWAARLRSLGPFAVGAALSLGACLAGIRLERRLEADAAKLGEASPPAS